MGPVWLFMGHPGPPPPKYHIASLFDMYIDMGERIAGKQDMPSLMIEHPLRAH